MTKSAKVVVLSGGSKGLGQCIAEHFLANGDIVATFSRKKTPFIEKCQTGSFQDQFLWEAIDGTDFEKVEQFAKKVFQQYQQVDILINNAATATDGILTLLNKEKISQLLSLNLEGTIRLTQSCAKYMLVQKSGIILNISSIIGMRGYSGLSVYSTTKAGLDGFTRSLARELGPRGIRVNSVSPGYLETEMTHELSEKRRKQIINRTPLKRLGKVEDVIGLIEFLASPKAQFITGQILTVDGGFTV